MRPFCIEGLPTRHIAVSASPLGLVSGALYRTCGRPRALSFFRGRAFLCGIAAAMGWHSISAFDKAARAGIAPLAHVDQRGGNEDCEQRGRTPRRGLPVPPKRAPRARKPLHEKNRPPRPRSPGGHWLTAQSRSALPRSREKQVLASARPLAARRAFAPRLLRPGLGRAAAPARRRRHTLAAGTLLLLLFATA